MVLHIAETYHIPPWELVENCTGEWWGYLVEWMQAKTKANKNNG